MSARRWRHDVHAWQGKSHGAHPWDIQAKRTRQGPPGSRSRRQGTSATKKARREQAPSLAMVSGSNLSPEFHAKFSKALAEPAVAILY